jgi:hypothetical protein
MDLKRKVEKKRDRSRVRFLRLLERDCTSFLCCRVCGVLHYFDFVERGGGMRKVERIVGCLGETQETVRCVGGWEEAKRDTAGKKSLCFGIGIYYLEPALVRLATMGYNSGGICPQLLACSGKRLCGVMKEKSLENEGEESLVPLQVAEIFTHERTKETDSLKRQRLDYSWTDGKVEQPKGGGLKSRFDRLRHRLKEVRITVQGTEWFFYFPWTLLSFLPASKPYYVLQSSAVEPGSGKSAKIRKKLRIPWIRKMKRTASEETSDLEEMDDGGDDDVDESGQPGSESAQEDDTTGWIGYYDDLEGPHPVSFRYGDGGIVIPSFTRSSVFCVYERKMDDHIPWYDTPRNQERLAWYAGKREKWSEW